MRRTRHVVLPVRSWQYIGLLIVSLACLTLGLVSRDREGHSGSLAGPELTHRAPHEVDACPNLNPFAQVSAEHLITEPEKAAKPINDHEIKVSKSPISRRLSRSLSLDRLSRIGSRKIEERSSSNLRAIERLSRSRTRVSDNESVNRLRESRFRTIVESHNARNSYDPVTRLSRSQDLSNRATDRRSIVRDLERRVADRTNSRSRSTERRELNEIARWQNRVDRSVGRQNFPNLQARMNDRRSLSMERRESSEINRQESRDVLAARREYRDLRRTRVDHRSEMRERRVRSVERRDAERSNRREDRERLLKARSEDIARGDIDRNNNLNRRNRKRSLDTRRALLDRVANQERRVSSVRNSRKDLVRSNDRRSQFRSMDRMNDFDRETLNRRVRSVESNIERSSRLSSERRSLARSAEINRIDHQRIENRLTGRRSLDRMTSRVPSENVRRERINRSQRIVSQRDSRGNVARDNSIINLVRSVYESEDISSRERRDRHIRSSRSVDRNSMYRREFAKIKESRDRRSHDSSTEQRDLIPERRERTNRVYRSREERRIVPQQSREQIGRLSRRAPERRVLERRDLRRSSERKIDENARSREASRMTDRRLERNSELRISHGRILEKRSTPNSRKSFERRIDDSSRLREGSRMQNRHVERNSEPRDTISIRMMDRRANRAAAYDRRIVHSLEKRWDARRDQQVRSLEERRARSAENRFTESLEKDSIRQFRHRLSNLNVKDSSRLTSLRRVIRASQVPEQNRQQRTLSAERMVSRITSNDRLSAKWEKNSQDASVEKTGAKIVLKSMDYELFKYPATYDFMKQAVVVALCTVYGLSLYNGKKTLIGNNMVQQMQRFIVW
ncbi:zinc finger CCCH domain-containing protein 13-like [Cataglyphis hispanica]|uniref:zinc finger CCCH domain-containing protein 13-like n=1 Tax=Cataglyphis hispanica TaxID=1086592 RepID=UPI00217FAC94|nr:zinc finger CCCH domain-containing protein 13-like [Cataglyphis hispanica]XP_050445432.1 zinc finger CCCH domain-containing protein 13-like [Cataglyphis hispanica]